ncbi:MAG: DNA cytosine methyltransferase, partial [Candidatus Paceibacterota bacterium]
MSIPVIDIFAGPGGLGEGFSSVKDDLGLPFFDIKLSIEKDEDAHKTLVWRSFYRQFIKQGRDIPDDYYSTLEISDIKKKEKRIEEVIASYPEGLLAREESLLIELGASEWPAKKVDKLIRRQLGANKTWILIGGPPCQAYSNVGRSRVGGIDPEDHRVYLYREYLRIIKEHVPTAFVMENVSGLLSAKVNGEYVFDWIIDDLKCGGQYDIYSFVKEVNNKRDYLIKSEKYGIPQKRHRVILLGLKKGINHSGKYLTPISGEVNLKKVIDSLPKIRSALNRTFSHYDPERKYKNGKPKRVYKNLIDTDRNWSVQIQKYIEKISSWGELKLNGVQIVKWESPHGTGDEFVKKSDLKVYDEELNSWIVDENLSGVPNHESRSHLAEDLLRYLFASLYVDQYNRFPRLQDLEEHNEELLP